MWEQDTSLKSEKQVRKSPPYHYNKNFKKKNETIVTLAYYISGIPFEQQNYSIEKNEHEMKVNTATARALNVPYSYNSRHLCIRIHLTT